MIRESVESYFCNCCQMPTNFSLKLLTINAHLLEQIIEKFDYRTGIKFYSTSQEAKDYVDYLKPRWTYPGVTLQFNVFQWCLTEEIRTIAVDKDFSFLRVDGVKIFNEFNVHFAIDEKLVSQLKRMEKISYLDILGLKHNDIFEAVLNSTMVYEIRLFDYQFDLFVHLKKIPSVRIKYRPFNPSIEIPTFFMMNRHREVTLELYYTGHLVLQDKLKEWSEGAEVGRLEKIRIVSKNRETYMVEEAERTLLDTGICVISRERKESSEVITAERRMGPIKRLIMSFTVKRKQRFLVEQVEIEFL